MVPPPLWSCRKKIAQALHYNRLRLRIRITPAKNRKLSLPFIALTGGSVS